MSIGIDFILRAKTEFFTRNMAAANNAIGSLKKSLRTFDVGNGLKQALGVGGVIAAFRSAINNAQELRDEADKLGTSLDRGTRSVAELGDAFDKIGKAGVQGVTFLISGYTQLGETLGSVINRMRGISEAQENIRTQAAKGAEEQEKNLENLKKKQAERAPILAKELKDQKDKNALDAMTPEERLKELSARQSKLIMDSVNMGKGQASDEKALAASKMEPEIRALQKQVQDRKIKAAEKEFDLAEKQDKEYEKQQEEKKKLVQKFAPSVEELAAQNAGGFADANSPVLKARQALQAEDRARMLFERGDYKGGLAQAQKASGLREGLSMQTGEGGPLTQKTATDAFQAALTETNGKLETLTKAVSGIIKAQ